jgi:hypothetical protein
MNIFRGIRVMVVGFLIIYILKIWNYFIPYSYGDIIENIVFYVFVFSLFVLYIKNFNKLIYNEDLDSLFFPIGEPPLDKSLISKIAAICCALSIIYLIVFTIV